MSRDKQESRHYWRSLERLHDSPVMQSSEEEFPDGASLPPGEVDRRTLMKVMGASLAMAGMAACRRPEQRIVPYVVAPERVIPGVPVQYATTVTLGTNAVGILVESHEGRPTKIEGNELHPSSLGAADSWTQASILNLYDPDRSRTVRSRGDDESLAGSTWTDFDAAWNAQAAGLAPNGGAGLAILAEESCSPTIARLAAGILTQYPQARWVSYGPISDRNIFAGLEMATGQAVRPRYQLEQADIILALDCDFLLTESNAVANARAFATGRRPSSGTDKMKRLYVAESSMSVTGANADHRWRIASGQIPALVQALAGALGVSADISTVALPPEVSDNLAALAADLQSAGSRAVVMAGRHHSPEVHAAVYALNFALGAIGQTVLLESRQDLLSSPTADLADLVAAMGSGQIETLLILEGNPVYDAPAELDFQSALGQVGFSVHLSSHVDETSQLVSWHLPASHYLESWSDVRNADGSTGVCQPLIAPLFSTRSTVEMLGLIGGGAAADAYQEVRTTWATQLSAGRVESSWNQVLHDGLLASTTTPVTATAPATFPALSASSGSGIELVLRPSGSLYDGRFANNSWLQELPDAISKITWDNALHMSPADAGSLGVSSGDVVTVSAGERTIEAPAWISPGQAAGSVSLSLGYGRLAAGNVGSEIGVNGYALGTVTAPVAIERTGRRHQLVQTQEHWSMEGRSLVREATLTKYQEDPEFATRPDDFTAAPLWAEHDYSQGYQWGMTIDLGACTGCSACVIACQSENNIPVVGKEQVERGREMHWLRIDRYYSGGVDNPGVVFQPVTCMHCENAPCEEVCPVAATVHDSEGLNAMVYNRCIGTRYCSNNCPYKVRRFNFFNFTKDTPETMKLAHNPDVTVRSRGVMEKCSYCLQRISQAKISAKSEGRQVADGEIKTACQQTCPSDAIVFGNINDPASRVARLKDVNRSYQLLAELYNKPRTSYLARVTNPNRAISANDNGADKDSARE